MEPLTHSAEIVTLDEPESAKRETSGHHDRRAARSPGHSVRGVSHRQVALAAAMTVTIASTPARAHVPGPTAAPVEPTDSFVADDGLRSFRESYLASYRPARQVPHYVRAAGEMMALLGVGTAMYHLKGDQTNWDYPDVPTRFRNLELAFDTNPFVDNHIHHPIAGGLYYLFARTNGLSIPAAAAYSITSSALWEFVLEWWEKPSINDLVMTPMGGLPAGEFFVHLGDYFNSAPGGGRWYHQAAGVVLGPTHRIHRALDGRRQEAARPMPADRLGLSSFYAHRFEVVMGATGVANDRGDHGRLFTARLAGEIVSIPGFLRPGHFGVSFSDGEFTEAIVQAGLGEEQQHTWDLFFDANLFGRYAQAIDLSGGRSVGRAWMFAFNTSARYADHALLGRRDNYAMAHVAGPAVKLWGVVGDLVARLEGAAHLDFAGIRSQAYPQWIGVYGDDGTASVLRAARYYYGVGWSARARGVLSYKFIELGTRAFYGRYESIDRWDRFESDVTRDEHAVDSVAEIESWLAIAPRDFPLQVRGFAEHLPRRSAMAPISVTRWDRRFGFAIGGQF